MICKKEMETDNEKTALTNKDLNEFLEAKTSKQRMKILFIHSQKNEDINVDYIYITSSNKIESPNDKILFNPNQKMIYFRNVKTNVVTSKSINTLSFIQNMGKFYDIYDFYKAIYQNENIEEIYNNSNPSSSPSSQFK